MAHRLALNSETAVRGAKEELLKAYLVEYNMALLRFNLEEKKWPADISELTRKKGYLRNLYPDPFTKRADYLLIEKKENKYIVSASAEKSLSGIAYNQLCVNAAGKFVPVSSGGPPPLVRLMSHMPAR
ncbi:MAG TPA: hypothetical protein PK467_14305 [Candidatus Wallbacteria bacterium]|nr:hypothetical protein [Candidatus Wallbacteria bacterium]